MYREAMACADRRKGFHGNDFHNFSINYIAMSQLSPFPAIKVILVIIMIGPNLVHRRSARS